MKIVNRNICLSIYDYPKRMSKHKFDSATSDLSLPPNIWGDRYMEKYPGVSVYRIISKHSEYDCEMSDSMHRFSISIPFQPKDRKFKRYSLYRLE